MILARRRADRVDASHEKGGIMSTTRQAAVERGDIVTVSGRRVGDPGRLGEILDVLGPPDHPHYAVRWEDGHQTILYPGETTSIVTRHERDRAASHAVALAPATQDLVDTLRSEGVEFELLPHRRTTTASSEAHVLGVLPQVVAKTVIARTDEGGLIRAVVPATRHLSVLKLASAVGAKSAAVLEEADLVTAYPQFELGAVPPFGGPAGDRVVVDRSLLEQDHVVLDGGAHDMSLRLQSADLVALADAQVADIGVS
jgi:Cys-tRNA(Pro) deacylase